MKKASLLLAGIIIILLCGCGSTDAIPEQTNTPPSAVTAQATPSTMTDMPEPTPEPGEEYIFLKADLPFFPGEIHEDMLYELVLGDKMEYMLGRPELEALFELLEEAEAFPATEEFCNSAMEGGVLHKLRIVSYHDAPPLEIPVYFTREGFFYLGGGQTTAGRSGALNEYLAELTEYALLPENSILTGKPEDIESVRIDGLPFRLIGADGVPFGQDEFTVWLDSGEISAFAELLLSSSISFRPHPSHQFFMGGLDTYIVTVGYADGSEDVLYVSYIPEAFGRCTGTYGSDGDQGYVYVHSAELGEYMSELVEKYTAPPQE